MGDNREMAKTAGGQQWRVALPIALSLLAALAAVVLALSAPGVAPHLARLLALVAALSLWIGDVGPKGPVALLLLVFVDLLGLAAGAPLFGGFAEPAFFFLLAVLAISTAIGLVGTARRVAQRMIGSAPVGGLAWQLPAFMLGSAALISSATARVSLMHPVLDDVAQATRAGPGLRRYLTLFVANLNPLTSRAFLSGGPGIVVAAQLMGRAGHQLSWGEWALWMGVPVAVIFGLSSLAHWLWLRPGALPPVSLGHDPFVREDYYLIAVVAGLVLLWIFGPAVGIGAAAAALLGMASLALLRQWPRLVREIDWDLVLFAGATISFAGILLESGTAAWMGELLFSPLQDLTNPYLATFLVFSVLVLLRLPLSNGVSYSAVVFPIILSLGDVGGLESLHVAFMALVAGGLVFLPVQSNPTMISYASGRFGTFDSVLSGSITFLAALAVFQWLAVPYWVWLAG